MRFANGLLVFTKAVVFSILTATIIHADVIYDFVGTGTAGTTPEPVGLVLTVANFVDPAPGSGFVSFNCTQLDSSTNCDFALLPPPEGAVFFSNGNVGVFSAQLQFDAANDVSYIFYFPTGAFAAAGTYSAESGVGFNPGTLTVSQVPEPSAMLLMLSVFSVFGLRRLIAKRSTAA